MKSLVLTEVGKLEFVVNEEAEVPADCAKIRIARASITSSDISSFKGKTTLPITPSRIAMGLVSECSDFSLKTGQRVMLSPYHKEGNTFSTRGVDIDGYLADYVICPLKDIYTMPEGISDESIVFIEDIALAVCTLEKLDIKKAQYILLNGCSAFNFIVAQLALYYQAIPVIIDKNQQMLDLAQDLGIYYTINPSEEKISQKVKEITCGKLCDCLVVDTDSYPNAEGLLDCLKYGSKICLTGLDKNIETLEVNLAPVFTKAIEIFGINNGDGEIETAINMLATEIVKVDNLIDKVADISETEDIISQMAKQGCPSLKTIIKC